MTRPISGEDLYKAVGSNTVRVTRVERKPLSFEWVTPCDTGPCVDNNGELTGAPVLQNGFAQPALPLEKFAFRRHADHSLEFKGHLDTSGATSGTVAVTLPDSTLTEQSYRLDHDQYFHTTITDGVTFTLALVFIEASSGDVTLTWPAS